MNVLRPSRPRIVGLPVDARLGERSRPPTSWRISQPSGTVGHSRLSSDHTTSWNRHNDHLAPPRRRGHHRAGTHPRNCKAPLDRSSGQNTRCPPSRSEGSGVAGPIPDRGERSGEHTTRTKESPRLPGGAAKPTRSCLNHLRPGYGKPFANLRTCCEPSRACRRTCLRRRGATPTTARPAADRDHGRREDRRDRAARRACPLPERR
jgi:hypothetical protein